MADPKRFLTLAGSSEKYISLLRQIAANYSVLPTGMRVGMRTTPFILGFERIASGNASSDKKGADDDEEEEGILQYRLAQAKETTIVDDTTLLNDFAEFIITCPQDDLIEAFVEVSRHATECKLRLTIPRCKATGREEDQHACLYQLLVVTRASDAQSSGYLAEETDS